MFEFLDLVGCHSVRITINPHLYSNYNCNLLLLCRYSTTGPDGGTYYVQLCNDAPQCVSTISMCHIDSSGQLHKLGESVTSVFVQDGNLMLPL